MKTNYRMWNLSSSLRLGLVGLLSLGGTSLIGILGSQIIDLAFRVSNSSFWRNMFQTLSQFKVPAGMIITLMGIGLFSRWIMAPAFNDFSEVVSASLQPEAEQLEPVKLPKSLHTLETRLNDINKDLHLWKYAVREAEQRKDDLVVYLAHDIRTPLTSILGYLELVVEHPEIPEKERQKYTEIALRKAERMQVLVEELFEITRFNVSQIDLNKKEVNASIFINQLAEETAPLLAERNIQLEIKNDGVEKLFIDADKMARAVDNILHNAASYTPEGETVRIVLDDESGQNRIRISNTGNEISQEKLDRLFEKFYRGDDARQSGTGGVGLGLAIAKNLVEAHGGSLTANNENRVTTFIILI